MVLAAVQPQFGVDMPFAAYFDLRSDNGPLHARAVADLGRRLLAGAAFPRYQSATPINLRRSIEEDHPSLPRLADPRDLPVSARSDEWSHLCTCIDSWGEDLERSLRTAQVLDKLGFWSTINSLPCTEGDDLQNFSVLKLTRIRLKAQERAKGSDGSTIPAVLYESYAAHALDKQNALPLRLSVAVNLLVHHARFANTGGRMELWGQRAQDLYKTGGQEVVSNLLASVYWRGLSFLPFYAGDLGETRAMLDEAERTGLQALESDECTVISALENLRLISMSRAQAETVFDNSSAAEFYRCRVVELDPSDASGYAAYGDFLFRRKRYKEAWTAYRQAARCGAPVTQHARRQIACCALRLSSGALANDLTGADASEE